MSLKLKISDIISIKLSAQNSFSGIVLLNSSMVLILSLNAIINKDTTSFLRFFAILIIFYDNFMFNTSELSISPVFIYIIPSNCLCVK